MEQEIQDISIQLIQKHRPQLKGIDNDLIVDYTEFCVPDDNHPIHHYPIRLDCLFIGLREKGLAKFNINLKEIEAGPNDLVICSPGDLMHANLQDGIHLSQVMMVSSHFLKEMYISLNSFMCERQKSSWTPQGVTWLGTFDLFVYLASQFFPFLGRPAYMVISMHCVCSWLWSNRMGRKPTRSQ